MISIAVSLVAPSGNHKNILRRKVRQRVFEAESKICKILNSKKCSVFKNRLKTEHNILQKAR